MISRLDSRREIRENGGIAAQLDGTSRSPDSRRASGVGAGGGGDRHQSWSASGDSGGVADTPTSGGGMPTTQERSRCCRGVAALRRGPSSTTLRYRRSRTSKVPRRDDPREQPSLLMGSGPQPVTRGRSTALRTFDIDRDRGRSRTWARLRKSTAARRGARQDWRARVALERLCSTSCPPLRGRFPDVCSASTWQNVAGIPPPCR